MDIRTFGHKEQFMTQANLFAQQEFVDGIQFLWIPSNLIIEYLDQRYGYGGDDNKGYIFAANMVTEGDSVETKRVFFALATYQLSFLLGHSLL